MKKTIFFTLCLSAFITFSASAKIWRVNNNPGVNADFTDVQAAHDAAIAGDTIHVEPSGTNYGNLLVTKKLVILGNGYFLDQNTNLQSYPITSQLGEVRFRLGSSGSTISGFTIEQVILDGDQLDGVIMTLANITIKRNYITNITGSVVLNNLYGNISNIVIAQNYINGNIYSSGNLLCTYSIYNNYLAEVNITPLAYQLASGGIISNNVFLYQTVTNNANVKNNIFITSGYGINNSDTNFPNTVSNNIYASSSQPLGAGAINNIDMSTVFMGATGNTTDSQWQLKSGSPAIGAGANGENCGMFGGANPYKLSGLLAIPSIYLLTTAASNTTTLPVTISVKSNN